MLFIFTLFYHNHAKADAVPDFTNGAHYEVYATLSPINQAKISSEITAKITKINFKPGQSFNKGQTLIQFDCNTILLKIERIQAILKGTKADLESNQKLKSLDSISHVELAKSESEHQKALAELHLLENDALKCQIDAPYNGEVTAISVNENEIIKTGDPIIEIVSNQLLEVQMFIPSDWLNKISLDSTFIFEISELGNMKFNGKINKIVSKVDTASQSILVFGQLNQHTERLFAGMSGIVTFTDINNKMVNINEK